MHRFQTVAVPHEDVMKKQITMDVFAADLWNAFQGRGPDEYTDTDTFFRMTHMTSNLKDLLAEIKDRVEGKGGDGFLHIETPFGGGKTHALIAMYHSAKKWGAKPVVIVGTAMSKDDTPWGMIEKQLDGKIDKLEGNLAPGREKLRAVLEKHGSVIILIDELMQYVSMATGVKMGSTTLGSQAIAFIQQLSEEVSSLNRICVVASLPASTVEFVDREASEELLQKIRKVSGRKERKITPINPTDIPDIIRSRLFSTPTDDIKENSHEITSKFSEYCKDEGILPPGKTAKKYNEEFKQTYPFIPQVIDVLYQDWGSFLSFQRTRGVLRLLALVVRSLKDKDRPFITLADFDLEDSEIRRELLHHVGAELDSVISKDVTDQDSGSRKVEREMKSSVETLGLGIRCSTSIFMQSFSSTGKHGATMNQIKRDVSRDDMHSAIVDGIVINFKSKLSYIKNEDDRYMFSTVPNINRLKLDKMENITDDEVAENEMGVLRNNMGKKLNPRIWPDHKDVDDLPDLKMVIMREDSTKLCIDIMEKKGSVPRIHRNAVLFLCPSDAERGQFVDSLKSKIALQKISNETSLKQQQKTDVLKELKKEDENIEYLIRKYYRTVRIPDREGRLPSIDLGVPTVGMMKGISDHAYEALIKNQEIHEKLGPKTLEGAYLEGRKFVHTATMYESMLKTPGSRRPVNKEVVQSGIMEGAKNGTFGIGKLDNGVPTCIHFNDDNATVEFSHDEIIMQKHLCNTGQTKPIEEHIHSRSEEVHGIEGSSVTMTKKESGQKIHTKIHFRLDVPEGRLNEIIGTLMLINEKFRTIIIQINANDGSMTDVEAKKIKEVMDQMGGALDL